MVEMRRSGMWLLCLCSVGLGVCRGGCRIVGQRWSGGERVGGKGKEGVDRRLCGVSRCGDWGQLLGRWRRDNCRLDWRCWWVGEFRSLVRCGGGMYRRCSRAGILGGRKLSDEEIRSEGGSLKGRRVD